MMRCNRMIENDALMVWHGVRAPNNIFRAKNPRRTCTYNAMNMKHERWPAVVAEKRLRLHIMMRCNGMMPRMKKQERKLSPNTNPKPLSLNCSRQLTGRRGLIHWCASIKVFQSSTPGTCLLLLRRFIPHQTIDQLGTRFAYL